ncbi:MAG TPA: enoyl-CoA hydratase-related protein [Albidovulum sp.]|uniref:enoyl-CoA hydratase-related protein n=1 Tax=Albidovulum sp. TaxID=1872424 RepID=UPI002CDCC4B8|nr:enoyl-CoA hydratase-related protein [Albidovulum sp.]
MDAVTLKGDRGIGWITIDSPPVNALSAPVRKGLAEALDRAAADPAIRVVILGAAGRVFSAGADIREFGAPAASPDLPTVAAQLAAMEKPVIAALHGAALGGGLELALAARVRVAAPGTELGLPEVSLGLLPGAGGTQRLPRLIGAKAALGLMLSGLPVAAERAEAMGLVDAVVEGDAEAAAEKLARAHIDGIAELPTAAERGENADVAVWLAAVAEARGGLGRGRLPAPARIIDCVEAALLLPEDEGHVFEQTAYADLAAAPESAALRHVFLAERRAGHLPGAGDIGPRALDRIGLVGFGNAGAAVAAALLSSGSAVTMIEGDTETLGAALAEVAAHHDKAVQSGRLSAAQREAEWDRIEGSVDLRELERSDVVIVSGAEGKAEARRLLAEIDRVLRPGGILAVMGDGRGLAELAGATGRPDAVLALTTAQPFGKARVIEVGVTGETTAEVVAAGFRLVRRLGRIAVRSGVAGGGIGRRVDHALRHAMDMLVAAGASPYEIDRALAEWGYSRGPYQLADEAGLDDGNWLDAAFIAAGRGGRASGKGYYAYAEGARLGREDSDALSLIAMMREARGIQARPVGMREIQRRALAAMANEGARAFEEGAAVRPSDVDVVMVADHGFPRWRGGPMCAADQAGLLALRNDLRSYADEGDSFWQPAEVWDELIKYGRRFADLDED